MTVRSRMTLLISMIFILMTIVSTLSVFRESSEILNDEAELRMEEQLNRANENVSLLLNKIVLETELLSRDQKLMDYLKGIKDQEETDHYLYKLRAEKNEIRPVYMDLFITDLEGTIVSASMKEAIGVDTSNRSYYIEASERLKTATGDVINSKADNTQIVITLSPIFNYDKLIGYAGIAIHATYFSQFMESFEIHNSDYIILDAYDNILSHKNKAKITTTFDYFNTDKLDFYQAETIKINEEEYLVLQKKLSFKDWQIISYLKTEAIYSKSRELSTTFLIMGSIFILIAIGLSVYITNYVTKPIVDITNTINNIIEEEKQYKKTLINKIPLHRLETRPQPQEATEISEFRKAIMGFKRILDQGADQFELQNSQLKEYIHRVDKELNNINNRNLEFIQTLSHDIRTPLTLIKGYASGLASGEVQDEEMKKRFENGIVDSANNLEYLIYDVLDFAYELNDNHIFNKKEIAVEAFINKVTFKINQLYSKHDKVINIKPIETDSSYIEERILDVDIMQINRVIINLINNSIKYTETDQKIELTLTPKRDHITIEVYDEGMGISNEDQQNIFEMFYRGNNKGDTKGYGLGLYISQQILKGHESNLMCKSEINSFTDMTFNLKYKQNQ